MLVSLLEHVSEVLKKEKKQIKKDHDQYCQLTLDEQAKIIAEAEGGRGRNDEYLFSTEKKLTELGVSSVDLRYLVQQVKKIKS